MFKLTGQRPAPALPAGEPGAWDRSAGPRTPHAQPAAPNASSEEHTPDRSAGIETVPSTVDEFRELAKAIHDRRSAVRQRGAASHSAPSAPVGAAETQPGQTVTGGRASSSANRTGDRACEPGTGEAAATMTHRQAATQIAQSTTTGLSSLADAKRRRDAAREGAPSSSSRPSAISNRPQLACDTPTRVGRRQDEIATACRVREPVLEASKPTSAETWLAALRQSIRAKADAAPTPERGANACPSITISEPGKTDEIARLTSLVRDMERRIRALEGKAPVDGRSRRVTDIRRPEGIGSHTADGLEARGRAGRDRQPSVAEHTGRSAHASERRARGPNEHPVVAENGDRPKPPVCSARDTPAGDDDRPAAATTTDAPGHAPAPQRAPRRLWA